MRKSKITTLLLALASICVMAFFGACEMFHTPFVPILEGEEVFVYDQDGKRVDQDNVFLSIGTDTYYVQDNMVAKGYQVIEKSIYDFGETGKMAVGEKDGFTFAQDGKLVADEEFVEIYEDTYYLENNVVVSNDIVVESSLYFFNEDGKMFKGELDGNVFGEDGKLVVDGDTFVTVNENTYYIQNDIVVTGTLVLDGYFYNFGENGRMIIGEFEGYTYGDDGKLIGDEIFVTINNNTYYVENNIVIFGSVILNGYIYDFGEDGKMVIGDKNGNTYGEDGKLIGSEIFVTINNNTYYIINNIVVNGSIIINGSFYNFGDDGKMIVGEYDGYTYGEDGKLIGNEIFVTINNNTYYIENNIVVTGNVIIGGSFYDFGETGEMVVGEKGGYTYGDDGKLIADQVFVTINNNTYYLENNIVIIGSIIIDGYIYDFGEDGKMVIGDKNGNTYGEDGKLIGSEIFVTINNNTYYIINNIVVNGSIIINGSFYNFGDDGKMIVGEYDGYTYGEDGKLIGNEIFVTINNNTYYIENNIVVTGNVIIGGSFYDFGETGEMVVGEKGDYTYGADGKLVADQVFVTINNNTYYIINNIVITGSIVIDGYLYDFGETGEMFVGEKDGYTFDENGKLVADQVFVVINNNTYYIINNIVVTGSLQIDGSFYQFNEDGTMFVGTKDGYTYGNDGKLVGNKIFVTINNNTYYIVNNVTVHGYIVIDGYMYNFEDDGVMFKGEKDGNTFGDDGRMVVSDGLVTIDGNTYYVENNAVVTNTVVVIDNQLYIFDENGHRVTQDYGDVEFDENGNIVGDFVEIEAGENKYYVINNVIYSSVTVQGVVYESDNDLNPANNAKVSGVTCTATIGDKSFTAVTDSNGAYIFQKLPATTIAFSFARSGYFTASITVDCSTLTGAYTVVMDKEVRNTLTGIVVKADSDADISNNNTGLAGATLTLTRTSSTNTWSKTTTTASNGSYTFTDLTAGVYTLTIEKEGYLTITQTVQVRDNESNKQNIKLEAINAPSSPDAEVVNGYASGTVREVLNNSVVAGLTVYVRAGINNTVGEVLCKVTTDSNGYYKTEALAPGNYTAYVVDERALSNESYRYISKTIALKIMPGVTIANQNTLVSNANGLGENGIRLVLSWGSAPRDLDSYLSAPGGTLYYGTYVVGNCSLDHDVTSGYGPETITIKELNANWTYSYWIQDYTNRNSYNSTAMSYSGAEVNVYYGTDSVPAYTINITPNKRGTKWTVLTIDGATGRVTIKNTIG